MEISVAYSACSGDDPVEGVDIDLRNRGILQILQVKPAPRLIRIIVLRHAIHNAGDPMRQEDNHCANLQEFHAQVSHLTHKEYFEGT
jgi:hypothetical protein